MRVRKDGQQYVQDRSIQRQGSYTIDARRMLERTFSYALFALGRWRGEWSGSPEENRLREDIENFLALLRKEQS